VVLSGKVNLDMHEDSVFSRGCGSGAVAGPAIDSDWANYSMTAALTEMRKWGFGALKHWILYCRSALTFVARCLRFWECALDQRTMRM
jgi:hypothetical protein